MIENHHGQFRGGVRYGSTFEYGKLVFQWAKRENLTYIRWKGNVYENDSWDPSTPQLRSHLVILSVSADMSPFLCK